MTRTSIFIFACLTLLVGCDKKSPPPAPPPLATMAGNDINLNPRIILKGTEITANGKPLKYGATLEEWTQILGEKPRRLEPVYIWDNLGIRAYLMDDKKTVGALTIELSRKPLSSYERDKEYNIPGISIYSRSLFHGYLEFDGVRVHANSTVRSVNYDLKQMGKIRPFHVMRGLNVGSTVVLDDQWRISINITTDSQKYNSRH